MTSIIKAFLLISITSFFKGKMNRYIYYLKDDDGTVLTDAIIIINIYIPNLLKKCYNLGIEGLDEMKKFIYALIVENNEKLDSLIKEMEIVKEYVSDASSITNNDDDLKFNYDRELAAREELQYVFEEEGFEKGLERGLKQGIEQGIEQEKTAMIKSLFKNNVSIDIIAQSTDMSIEKIKQILEVDK